MKESLRYLFIEDFEQVMSEENDDDEVHHADDGHDHSQSLFRPSILLSGPYHYEVRIYTNTYSLNCTITNRLFYLKKRFN